MINPDKSEMYVILRSKNNKNMIKKKMYYKVVLIKE